MTRFHTIRLAGMLAGLAGALLTFTAASPAALAVHVPPPGGHGGTVQVPPAVHTIVTGGMPGWQITLIAVAAAVVIATLAVILDRAWAARRHQTAPITRPHHTETVAGPQDPRHPSGLERQTAHRASHAEHS